MNYLGDFTGTETISVPFQTFDSSGGSVTITGLATSDIEIYKDGGTTQRSSDAGYTVAADFDSITGIHMLTIDLSDNTDAGFFATGSEYTIVVSSITADSQTVNFIAGTFSIQNRYMRGTDSAATATALATAQADLDIITGADGVNLLSATQTSIDAIETDTSTTLQNSIDGLNDPTAASIADAVWDEAISGHTTSGTMGWYTTVAGSVLVDTTATGTPDSTTLQLTAGSTVDDFYNDQLVYITTGTGAGQVRVISDYEGSTKTITVDEAFVTNAVSGDRIIVQADHEHSRQQISEAILSTQLTEGYAADGVAPTLEECLMLIQQMATEKSISGVTMTVKKLDGSTTAAEFTLDDASAPTSVTRSS